MDQLSVLREDLTRLRAQQRLFREALGRLAMVQDRLNVDLDEVLAGIRALKERAP